MDFLGKKVSCCGNRNDILYQYSYLNKSKIYIYASSLGYIYVLLLLNFQTWD